VLDLVANATAEAAANSTAAAASSGTSTVDAAEAAARPLLKKFCGQTLGEAAATCGLAVAWKIFTDPSRKGQTVGHHMKRKANHAQKRANRKLRRLCFEAYGRYLNYREDLEIWWENFELETEREKLRLGAVAAREHWISSLQDRWTDATETAATVTTQMNSRFREQDLHLHLRLAATMTTEYVSSLARTAKTAAARATVQAHAHVVTTTLPYFGRAAAEDVRNHDHGDTEQQTEAETRRQKKTEL